MALVDYKLLISEAFSEAQVKVIEKRADGVIYAEADPEFIRKAAKLFVHDNGCILLTLFACDERKEAGKFGIYYAFGDRKRGEVIVIKTAVETEFLSISRDVPAASLYEREIKDMFGVVPQGHPDGRRFVFHGNWPGGSFPLRKDFDRKHKPEFMKRPLYFQKVQGSGTYEIPVGPVHAGIIEPGHFRFSVAGEPIINLEAQLYFVHKGIEKLSEGMTFEKVFYISERISGDETFSNSLAYCQAVEKIAGVKVPKRAAFTRMVFAELERLICHFGDLSGICTDVAYGFAWSHFNLLRIWSYQLADELCGVRFLRSVNAVGGVRKDFLRGKNSIMNEYLDKIEAELKDIMHICRRNNLLRDRTEHTGILENKAAVDLNAVGPGGRASGVRCDARKAFAYEEYDSVAWDEIVLKDGDVASRMEVKARECFESIKIMRQAGVVLLNDELGRTGQASGLNDGCKEESNNAVRIEITQLPPDTWALGITESSRGENVHFVMTDSEGNISRYKVRTPSYCNWPALCIAVNGNIVPDFPLINKSFNLSYAGNDL